MSSTVWWPSTSRSPSASIFSPSPVSYTHLPVLAQAPDGALLTIINQWQDWYLVNYNGTIGYAKDSFVTLN